MSQFHWGKEYEKYLKDPSFERKFRKFLKKMMEMVRDPSIPLIRVDDLLNEFVLNYIAEQREKRIKRVLRKKDI